MLIIFVDHKAYCTQPVVFYTDNMADKSFLKAFFPSLRASVVPVEKHGELESFVLPSDVDVEYCYIMQTFYI